MLYARQFSQSFDFIGLNRALIDRAIRAGGARLIAFDPSFIAKAGKHTPGRAYFWNGAHRRAEKGLEVSAFSTVDLEQHTGFTLSIQQTQPTIGSDGRVEDDTLIDRYLHRDANMRFFYTGPPRSSGSGRQKTYDGKVDWQDLSRFDSITDQDGLHLYTQVLNHVSPKRPLRVVVLLDLSDPNKPRYALLFSTDVELDAVVLYHYYKARFQIEFIFRDAKQFTGLAQCQSRDAQRLHFYFNASLTTLNIAKIEQRHAQPADRPMVYSMASVKACYFNEHFLQLIFSKLGSTVSWI